MDSQTITLTFAGTPKDVPVKTTVTRALMRVTEPVLQRLREVSSNKALSEAMLKDMNVLKLMTLSGGFNPDWEAEQRRIVTTAYPEWEAPQVNAEIGKRFLAQLGDAFPLVMQAYINPVSDIDTSNDVAINAGIDLVKLLVDQSQLNEEEKKLIATATNEETGENTFWDVQDLSEVVRIVNMFRGLVQR